MAKMPDVKKMWLVVDFQDACAVVIIADRRDDVLTQYAASNNLEPGELDEEGLEISNLGEMAREAVNAKTRNKAAFALFEVVSW